LALLGGDESGASVEDVKRFLTRVKQAIADPQKFVFIERDKNLRAAAKLGLIPRHEVLSLSYEDYDRGPLPDTDRSRGGSVWEFFKEIDGVWIYIKLKLDDRGCVCISFHEDQLSLHSLPYRTMKGVDNE
jgi:hypothetical protein